MSVVKSPRAYDSSGRRARAELSRTAVRDAAWRLFTTVGYARTTIAEIARQAGVSAETVYKSFGSKAGILRAIGDAALAGPDAMPTMRRSDEMAAQETDPVTIIGRWAAFASEVGSRMAPVVLLIRSASATAPELGALLAEMDSFRLKRMGHQARLLADRGYLRPNLTVAAARDVMWAYTDPAMYELLVLRRRWPIARYRDFLADALTVALLGTRRVPPVGFEPTLRPF